MRKPTSSVSKASVQPRHGSGMAPGAEPCRAAPRGAERGSASRHRRHRPPAGPLRPSAPAELPLAPPGAGRGREGMRREGKDGDEGRRLLPKAPRR